MRLHRRAIISFGAAAAIAPTSLAQTPAAPDPAIAIAAKAAEARLKLDFDGRRFSGPAYDLLLSEARRAQFFLIGEEHGIAENPKLAGQLFEALVPSGYRRLGIEVSPPMARELDAAARERLLPHFADDIALLAELTGEDFGDWLSRESRGSFLERRQAVSEPA